MGGHQTYLPAHLRPVASQRLLQGTNESTQRLARPGISMRTALADFFCFNQNAQRRSGFTTPSLTFWQLQQANHPGATEKKKKKKKEDMFNYYYHCHIYRIHSAPNRRKRKRHTSSVILQDFRVSLSELDVETSIHYMPRTLRSQAWTSELGRRGNIYRALANVLALG